ncbi:S-adenosyl-L-methionine-dependent methyltransferase [Whalleya microplaca]|nr:S-adenosyl-L-methionine-dependent methyltransferase [Whalleya microplaca]
MATPSDPPLSSIRYLPTNEAYDRWAAVYDTDGNFLQALDTLELRTLFPQFLSSITSPKPWRIVDLGCGTGRNTALLLTVPDTSVIALDSSRGMLAVAKYRLQTAPAPNSIPIPIPNQVQETSHGPQQPAPASPKLLHFELFDLTTSPTPPLAAQGADGVICTLVVEHVPLATFFAHAARILRPGGVLLLSNMHAQMGALSQAGFVDARSGEKIRTASSYAHTVAEVVAEAARWGLEVEGKGEGGIRERVVNEGMVGVLGARSRKWVGVACWFGGLFRKVR